MKIFVQHDIKLETEKDDNTPTSIDKFLSSAIKIPHYHRGVISNGCNDTHVKYDPWPKSRLYAKLDK